MFIGPILAVLLCGAAIFYLFRMLQESDRIAAQKLEKSQSGKPTEAKPQQDMGGRNESE